MDFVERGNVVVPLQQRGGAAREPGGVRVQFPDGIEHRMIVRIEDVFFELRVAGDMDLADAVVRARC